MPSDHSDVPQRAHTTGLLQNATDGVEAAGQELEALVYAELRRLAAHYMVAERANHTLQPTALVHEAFLRMVGQAELRTGGRERFLAVAAQAMRRVIIDHARTKKRLRRGGGDWRRVTLENVDVASDDGELDLVELDDLLTRLAARDARAARVVELRYFSGMTIDETAVVLGVSSGTVDNDWYVARAWLRRELRQNRPS